MFRMTVRKQNAITMTKERESLLSIEKLIQITVKDLEKSTGEEAIKRDGNNTTVADYSINLMIVWE